MDKQDHNHINSVKARPLKSTTASSSDNMLFSPSELKQMHHSEKLSKILKIAIPCLLVTVIGTTTYALQGKVNHLPDNYSVVTSGNSSQLSVPASTNTGSSQSSVPTPSRTSESTNPASTDSQTTNDSSLQAQLNAIQAQATASVNEADAQANANAAQAEASIQANNAAIAQEQAQATADLANANSTAVTPAEQASAAASAARLQCIAQAIGQLSAANDQLDTQAGTRGFNAVGTVNAQADIQNQLTSRIASCNNQ